MLTTARLVIAYVIAQRTVTGGMANWPIQPSRDKLLCQNSVRRSKMDAEHVTRSCIPSKILFKFRLDADYICFSTV